MSPSRAPPRRKKQAAANEFPHLVEVMMEALTDAGGAAYLKELAEQDPKTFCALLAKVLPPGPSAPSQIGITLVWQKDRAPSTMLENEVQR